MLDIFITFFKLVNYICSTNTKVYLYQESLSVLFMYIQLIIILYYIKYKYK